VRRRRIARLRYWWHRQWNKWCVTEHDDLGRIYIVSTHMTEGIATKNAAVLGPGFYVRWTEDAMARMDEMDYG